MFESVNAAYEFLSSQSSRARSHGPDAGRIGLCLRAQSIVFERNADDLAPYKYAGYAQLIKTINMETQVGLLFRRQFDF